VPAFNHITEGFPVQKIVPFLWFDGQAEEAMNFYVSIFQNSKVVSVNRCGDAGPGPKGSVLTATFQLEGQPFMALNGGPMYKFTPAVSLFVNCTTQAGVGGLWEKLTAGGEPQPCGWLRDKFGVSWQIIPTTLGELLWSKDADKSKRVMGAMRKMTKIDIAALQRAADGK
jgi:predicted 3-demethylubiquinone-9 3-methyltransferase (glyoxalase superfamily)